MLSTLKPVLFCVLVGSLTVYYYYHTGQILSSTITTPTPTKMSSPATSWKSRAQPHPSPSTYSPAYASLALLSMRDTPVAQNALTLALFTDKVAITASGEVVVLSQEDYDAVTALAETAKTLPVPDSFNHAWRVNHPITSRPIDHVRIGVEGAAEMHQFAVYGYDSERKELKEPVGDITHIPSELSELMEVVLEGRAGFSRDAVNQEIVDQVKGVLPA